MNQVELRRKDIADRFAHAWNKSSTRIPISVKEYRALLDLWEASKALIDDPNGDLDAFSFGIIKNLRATLEKLEKGG